MTFAMPLYDVKYHNWDKWEEISEIELMNRLYKICQKVTPAIKEMIAGKEIDPPEAFYRLKLKEGEKPDMPLP